MSESAKYRYEIVAPSGYEAVQDGEITPEQHCDVLRILNGESLSASQARESAALDRIHQFDACIRAIAKSLGSPACGGVDVPVSDPHGTAGVLVTAVVWLREQLKTLEANAQTEIDRLNAQILDRDKKLKTAETENECLAASCKAVTEKLEAAESLMPLYWKATEDDPCCVYRCLHCGAGDDDNHSFTCPTNMHPNKRDEYKQRAEAAEASIKASHEPEWNGMCPNSDRECEAPELCKPACTCFRDGTKFAQPPKEPTP